MRFDFHHHHDPEIVSQLRSINLKLEEIMSALSDLQAKVEANKTVVGSAVELLKGLKAKLDEALANGDQAALEALSAELGSETESLAAAVAENTPAAPTV